MNNKKEHTEEELKIIENKKKKGQETEFYTDVDKAFEIFKDRYKDTVLDEEMISILSDIIKSVPIFYQNLFGRAEPCDCGFDLCPAYNVLNFINKISNNTTN
jgi:hypothetical protein